MSLTSATALVRGQVGGSDTTTDGAAASSDRAPPLRAGGYAAWKPSMNVYLQRHGAADVHTEPQSQEEWLRDSSSVAAWNKQTLAAARIAALGAGPGAASGDGSAQGGAASGLAKEEPLSAEAKAGRALVAAHVERSRQAYGRIYSALQEDLRLQVAHLPQGWAYGLWQWLERKFQSTEADHVGLLLRRWIHLSMNEGESFDSYRARVNEVAALLKHAKEEQSPAMYSYVLLQRLQPRYDPVVLALQSGQLLKDPKAIDWDSVTALINTHERKEHQMADDAGSAGPAKAMAAARSQDWSAPKEAVQQGDPERSYVRRQEGGSASGSRPRQSPRTLADIQCFGCGEYGHMKSDCPKRKNGEREHNKRATERASVVSSGPAKSGVRVEIDSRRVAEVTYAAYVKKGIARAASKDSDAAVAGDPTAASAFKSVASPAACAPPVWSSDAAMAGRSAPAEPSAVSAPPAHRQQPRSKPRSKQRKPQSGKVRQHKPQGGKVRQAQGSGQARSVTVLPRAIGIDSMASLNISGKKDLFTSLRRCAPFSVNMADDGVVEVSQVGSVELHINVTAEQTISVLVDEVYYHPQFSANLLSLHWLTQHGWSFSSSKSETFLLTPDKLKVRLNKDHRVSVLRCSSGGAPQGVDRVYSVGELIWSSADDLVRLHERLGHMGFDRMLRIIKAETTIGLGKLSVTEASLKEARKRVSECRACIQGKGSRTAFGRRGIDKGSAPGESLHMDTYYVKVPQADGNVNVEYGLTVSDPHTTFRWFARLLNKAQGANAVVSIVRQAEKQFGLKVKRIHSDGGSEFINQTVKAACAQLGVTMHWGPRATPQLNSVAERQVRSSKDAARTLLLHAGLPARFWARAVCHAGFVWNRSNIAPETGVTPYEAVFKKKPSLEHLSVFGCDCYFHIPKEERSTFDAKMQPGIYLGQDNERSCAIVYDLRSGQEVSTRDVQFLDRRFTHAAALEAGGEQLDQVFAMEFDGDNTPVAGAPVPRMDFGAQEFEVERILGKRLRDGVTEYRVKWKGYGEDDISWEPAHFVEGGAQEAISEFEKEQLPSDPIHDGPDDAGAAPVAAAQPSAAGYGRQQAAVAPAAAAAEAGPASAPAELQAQAPAAPVVSQPQPAAAAAERQQAAPGAPQAPAVLPRRSPRGNASSASVDALSGQHRVHWAMSALCSSLPGGDDRLGEADVPLVYAVASGLSLLEDQTPGNWKEAMASPQAPQWRAAADKEMAGCEQMGVWDLVPRSSVPKWQIVVPCKWVFKIKVDATGAIDTYKARLTPKGFLQREGINFFETFAATGKYKSMRLGLTLTAAFDHELDQMDVPQAFLNADVDEEVYMELPEGYRAGREHQVCKLKKALYGLKQAPRNWYLLISKFVVEQLGYKATISDPCLFFKRSKTGRLLLLFLFVDDFQSSFHPEDKAEWGELKAKLVARFKTKDLGASTWILGMRITRDRKARTITLDQELYVTKALERYGLQQCKAAATPGAVSSSRDVSREGSDSESHSGGAAAAADAADGGQAPADRQLFQEMVGTLMYSAVSCRPDIAHAVQVLARSMQAPTQLHMQAAKRVFRYLAGSKDVGLIFGSRNGDAVADSRGRENGLRLDVCCFADADWANDKADRKSITGWVAKVNGDPISWASKKQRTVAQSTCEAELYAEAAAIQEVLWLRGLLKELGLHVQTGSRVFGDNQSTIAISHNGIKGERTKHVDVKYHFITETVESGAVQLKWIPTTEQQADIFTKALATPVFEHFRKLLMTR